MIDPFTILEIPVNSDETEIKRAYKRLARIHHPDKGGDPEKFKEISKAYEDALIPKPKMKRLHEVTLKQCDAYKGSTVSVHVNTPEPCPNCFCVMCGHTGQIQMGPFMCPCPNPHRQCNMCKIRHETFNISVPKYTLPGSILHIDQFTSFRINIEPDTILVLEGTDLVYTVDITFKESLVGTKISIPHYDGTFDYQIGFIKPSKKYLIKGKGFVKHESNLRFKFNIQYPDAFTEEQIEMFKKYL